MTIKARFLFIAVALMSAMSGMAEDVRISARLIDANDEQPSSEQR